MTRLATTRQLTYEQYIHTQIVLANHGTLGPEDEFYVRMKHAYVPLDTVCIPPVLSVGYVDTLRKIEHSSKEEFEEEATEYIV